MTGKHNQKFVRANLSGANFVRAVLTGADFTRANLTNANFTDANLSGANFVRAVLTGVDFTRANLTDANFSYDELTLILNIDKARTAYGAKFSPEVEKELRSNEAYRHLFEKPSD